MVERESLGLARNLTSPFGSPSWDTNLEGVLNSMPTASWLIADIAETETVERNKITDNIMWWKISETPEMDSGMLHSWGLQIRTMATDWTEQEWLDFENIVANVVIFPFISIISYVPTLGHFSRWSALLWKNWTLHYVLTVSCLFSSVEYIFISPSLHFQLNIWVDFMCRLLLSSPFIYILFPTLQNFFVSFPLVFIITIFG